MRADNVGAPVTPQQWNYIHEMGGALRSSLDNVTAVFAPSCIGHAVLSKRDWINIRIDSISLPRALRCWDQSTNPRRHKRNNNKMRRSTETSVQVDKRINRNRHNQRHKHSTAMSEKVKLNQRLTKEERQQRRRHNQQRKRNNKKNNKRLAANSAKHLNSIITGNENGTEIDRPHKHRKRLHADFNNRPGKQNVGRREKNKKRKRRRKEQLLRQQEFEQFQHKQSTQQQLITNHPRYRPNSNLIVSSSSSRRGKDEPPKKCSLRLLERCSWPQCNQSCPSLTNPLTGEEMRFLELLSSFGLDIEGVATALGIDMVTLNNMDRSELVNLLTQQTN